MGPVSTRNLARDYLQPVKEINMRNLHDVFVTDAIVHILEPKAGKKTISERAIPLTNNLPLSSYFAEHIRLSSMDAMARTAAFIDRDRNKPSGICPQMFATSDDFINGSRFLAEKLYSAMERDQRVSDGDLVVCRYTVGTEQDTDYMAIIKLDPVGAFRNVVLEDNRTGKRYVDLQIDPFVFPRTTDILQKGAYIGTFSESEHFNILLLDKQLKGPEVAQFFYDDFLNVSFVQDPAELTLQLYKCLIAILNELRPTITPAIDRLLGNAIYKIFNQQTMFDIDGWVNTLKVPAGVAKKIENDLEAELPGVNVIPLDFTLVQGYVNRRTFSGQMTLNFSVPAAGYDMIVQSVTNVKKPGKQDYYEIVIHSATWNEEP